MSDSIDLVISFDTTGSMYPCLTQVRRNVETLVRQLFSSIATLRIAIIAHGDYCDAGRPYVTKQLDFTSNPDEICKFVRNVEQTGGGDAPECYELVLHEARSLSWKSGHSKALVLIGDDVPHGPNESQNKKKLDWRNELALLIEANIHVYGVHAMPGCRRHSRPFYEEIAKKSGGFYLTLDQFSTVSDMIKAIAFKQDGGGKLEQFAQDIQTSGQMTRERASIFSTLLNKNYVVETTVRATATSGDLIPVPTGRFQTMNVDATTVIATFVADQGVSFKPGRGFYQLTKSEEVQSYKEIVLVDKKSRDMYTGAGVRALLGIGSDSTTRLSSKNLLDKYEIFIQSTSYNRKLTEGTKFLYEVDDWVRAEAA